MKRVSIQTCDIPFGPGQPSLRLTTDQDSITLEAGLTDPWRPTNRLVFPRTIVNDLRRAIELMDDATDEG